MASGYREVQRLHPALRVLIAVSCLAAGVAPLAAMLAMGGMPARGAPPPVWLVLVLFAVFGLAFPALMIHVMRLEVEVREDALYVRFVPLRTRRIPYSSILRCEACAYRPIRDYGGWGIRWGGRRNWAYTMRGDRGVRLTLDGGHRLLVGSQTPEDLARAIEEKRTRLP